jgi:predicted GIY-YIG superfamily endonuclease
MNGGWVYNITNKRDGVIYVGVTSNLPKRAWNTAKAWCQGSRNATD